MFKVGDKVIVTDSRFLKIGYKNGDSAKVFQSRSSSSCITMYDGQSQMINNDQIVLQSIYNSPLYQLMREVEDA